MRFRKRRCPPSPWASQNRDANRLALVIFSLLALAMIPTCLLTFSGVGERDLIKTIEVVPVPSVPKWSPDGASLVFNHPDGKIYLIEADGSHIQLLSERSEEHDADYHPDISPDGTRVVYATLQYKTGFLWDAERNYEIVTSGLDGSDKRRLTKNKALDAHPVWSPDGSLIAFVSDRSRPGFHVYVMDPDGSNVGDVASSVNMLREQPPVWSPDSSKIAFVARAEEMEVIGGKGFSSVVYTVGADGSDLTKLGNTLSNPSWSPDGRRIAFIMREAGSAHGKLYTINHDGSDPREIISLQEDESARFRSMGNVAWSPDGSEIQFRSYVIRVDGSGLRQLPGRRNAWSPDGSKIATSNFKFDKRYRVLGKEFVLHTIARDGSDRRVVATENHDGSLSAAYGRLVGD